MEAMSTASETLTRDAFREIYGGRKPYFELLDGHPVQKTLPTRLHAIMLKVLDRLLEDLGFQSRSELTLAISTTWEPIPDVCCILGPEEDPYPTRPVAVAVEILSPADPFSRVNQKCRKYAEWGIQDILVYDPVQREVWYWDHSIRALLPSVEIYRFRSLPVEISHAEVFHRMEKYL